MTDFSPGLIQGCFEILDLADRQILKFRQLESSFPELGGIPVDRIIDLAQRLRWLKADVNGNAIVAPAGSRLQKIGGYQQKLRQALLDYIDVEMPPWLQNAPSGRSRMLAFTRVDILQVFAEAGLTDERSKEVVSFWDALSSRARGLKNDRLTEIGREGERLTIEYETARTGRIPEWIAIESNEDGYDILSVVSKVNSELLSIEVKTSSMGLAGDLFLTRNEWDHCKEVEHHCFYLWAVKRAETLLAKINPRQMRDHLPKDGGKGEWLTTQVPFSTFRAAFFKYSPG